MTDFPSYLLCNLLLQMLIFTQVMKLKFGHDKFGKRIVLNLKTRIHLKKKPRGQDDEMFQNLSIRMAKCF